MSQWAFVRNDVKPGSVTSAVTTAHVRGARAAVELARARQLRDSRAAIDRAGERDDSAERYARNGARDVEDVEVDLRAADAAAGVGRAGRGEVVEPAHEVRRVRPSLA